jgi:site-specific DNA-methyltransferase (adenine-specific)
MSEYRLPGGTGRSVAENVDCVQAMKQYPDGYFDLAVVDPPYGGGQAFRRRDGSRFGGIFDKYKRTEQAADGRLSSAKKIVAWDNAPGKEYFDELFRVSKQQIIWGGNYFELPPCRCFLIWQKTNIPDDFTMAQAEYAWTSYNDNAKIWRGISGRSKGEEHFHPTEKPQALYAWIYNRFARQGYKILDTHLGSGTSRRAAWDAGLDFTGFEIDKEYFTKQEEAFASYVAQLRFADTPAEQPAAEQLLMPL